MTIKYRGAKIVPVRITRYEVRTVDNRKLKSFGSTAGARAWIDGYVTAVATLTPKHEPKAEPKRRRPRSNGQPAAQASE